MIDALTDIEKELNLAAVSVARWHLPNVRKGRGKVRGPYLVHPLRCVQRAILWGVEDPVLLKALLGHDVFEDNPAVSVDEVREVLGYDSTEIIQEMTMPPGANKSQFLLSYRNKLPKSLFGKLVDRHENVCDFLDGGDPYALKYLNKANGLLTIAKERRADIVEALGEESYELAMRDFAILRRRAMGRPIR